MLAIVTAVITVIQGNSGKAKAAEKYIKVRDFIEYIVKQMNWPVDNTSDQPYIDAAMNKGILKEGDFKDYSEYLTRTDAAVIANRLDELIHLKCGYPQDVYDFLKDCTVYENYLFYSTEGKFYPKGATKETYPARQFNEEVVVPIIGEKFRDVEGYRTQYYYIYDSDVNIKKRYMRTGQPNDEYGFTIKPFNENAEVIKAWNIIHDWERKLNSVLEKRISDIKDISKSKREAVASIVAKGIIKGYSNGLYVLNREFRGNNKITANGAKDVIQKVLNPEKRALISPDGQLIRTTNLPKNAGDYKYILESFPNKYYEMNYSFIYLTDYITGVIGKDEYAYPKEVDYDFLYNKFYYKQINNVEIGKYGLYDEMISNVENYIKHIFNVDYRTVNNKWKEGLASSFVFYSNDNRVYNKIDRYIANIKKNHVVVELDKFAIDPGAIYESRGYLWVRAYIKYRVTTDDINVPSEQLIYNSSIKNLKNGKWREDIFDIFIEYLSEDYVYKWAPSWFAPISNWQYRDSFE